MVNKPYMTLANVSQFLVRCHFKLCFVNVGFRKLITSDMGERIVIM